MVRQSTRTVKRGFVELPEGSIHYREAGSGRPLILMHNATGSSLYFLDALPLLGERYRAVALDIFGHGDSDPPPRHFDIIEAARSTFRFTDALGIHNANVLGLHTGASIAAEMAILHPERVDRLIIMGSPDWPEERRVELRNRGDPMYEPSMEGGHLQEAWRYQVKASTKLSTLDALTKAAIASLQSMWWSSSVHKWVEDQYMTERLPLIKVPTMILSGEHDTMIDYVGPHMALLPEGTPAVSAILKDAGDFAPMEVPEEFTRVVVDFFERSF